MFALLSKSLYVLHVDKKKKKKSPLRQKPNRYHRIEEISIAYAILCIRKRRQNWIGKIAKENADVCTNLLSNSSGELVSTYDTFQRQSIQGAIPENRASPFFSFSYLFFSLLLSLSTPHESSF